MFNKTKINFWLDILILVTFIATALTGLLLWIIIPGGRGSGTLTFLELSRHTWLDLHIWAGLAMLFGSALHLILHGSWIVCVMSRFFKKLAWPARLNFFLDTILLAAFSLVSLSGLIVWLILPSGGYQGGRNPFYGATLLGLTRHGWSDLHLWTGLAISAVVIIHLALHWSWIVCMLRRYTRARPRRIKGYASGQL